MKMASTTMELRSIPADFIRCHPNQTPEQLFTYWVKGGEHEGWEIGKIVHAFFFKDLGRYPYDFEEESAWANEHEYLFVDKSWEQLEAEIA